MGQPGWVVRHVSVFVTDILVCAIAEILCHTRELWGVQLNE
jgi:hypothetical protein